MCTSKAFYYRRCRRDHIRFEQVSTCLLVRIGWRSYCPNRILNGDPNAPRAWPTIDSVCPECHPEKAAAQAEERRVGRKSAKKGDKGGAGEEKKFSIVPRWFGICGASR